MMKNPSHSVYIWSQWVSSKIKKIEEEEERRRREEEKKRRRRKKERRNLKDRRRRRKIEEERSKKKKAFALSDDHFKNFIKSYYHIIAGSYLYL